MKGGRTQRGKWFSFMTDSQPNETNIRRGGVYEVIRQRAVYLLQWLGIWHGGKQSVLVGSTPPRGFTVVETMIFLAVSGMLFFSAMTLIGGQQEKAEFNYGIQEFTAQVRDIINDVSTGFYPVDPGTNCFVTGTTTAQGTNSGCTFIGRVMHFGANDVPGNPTESSMRVYSVVGRRQINIPGGTRDVFNLAESETRPLPTSQEVRVPGGMLVRWVRVGGVGGADVGLVGYFTNFTKYSDESKSLLESAARNVDTVPIPFALNQGSGAAENAIRTQAPTAAKNPDNGVVVCVQSQGSRFYALMNLGGNLKQLSNDVQILSGVCP